MKRLIITTCAVLALTTSAFAAPPTHGNVGLGGMAFPTLIAVGVGVFIVDQQRGEAKCQAANSSLHYFASYGRENCVPLSQMPWAPPAKATLHPGWGITTPSGGWTETY